MSVIVVDTDVASTLLRRRASDALAGALAGHVLAITFGTVGELTKWTLVRRWGPRSLDTMRTFLAGLVVLPTTSASRPAGANCRPTHDCAADPAPPTTPGSPPAAWSGSFRWPP
ncbi:hypothetical protein [Pseudonocardia lacus]|uniref:hypothetical protein n=1 Tax=Pseudonocardia lacus TaxID=2835865 RepID=UPI0020287C5B|nr:hypothetical protein [Pseudonocardia lacus]